MSRDLEGLGFGVRFSLMNPRLCLYARSVVFNARRH